MKEYQSVWPVEILALELELANFFSLLKLISPIITALHLGAG
jgi:hypothetical protein